MKRGSPKRDWRDAEEKRTMCRVCAGEWVCVAGQVLELAHLIGRKHDKPKTPGMKTLWVDPDSVVPLCSEHHRAYDAHTLDLLPHLTLEEQLCAVRQAGGIELARRRLAPSAYRESPKREAVA